MTHETVSGPVVSASALTDHANAFLQELGKEFKRLHTREEYDYYLRQLHGRIHHNYRRYADSLLLDEIAAAGWPVNRGRIQDGEGNFRFTVKLSDTGTLRPAFDAVLLEDRKTKNSYNAIKRSVRQLLAENTLQVDKQSAAAALIVDIKKKNRLDEWIKNRFQNELGGLTVSPVFVDGDGSLVITKKEELGRQLFRVAVSIAKEKIGDGKKLQTFASLTDAFGCTKDKIADMIGREFGDNDWGWTPETLFEGGRKVPLNRIFAARTRKMGQDFQAKIYDSNVSVYYETIIRIFQESLEDCADLSQRMPLRYDSGKEAEILRTFDEYAARLRTQEEIDRQFLTELCNVFDRENTPLRGSADYLRRLVIRRLRKISPEFVCETDADGRYVIETEGAHKGEYRLRADLDDPEKFPTSLLILKQFVKQFGWGEGVKGDDNGRGFECPRLKALLEGDRVGEAAGGQDAPSGDQSPADARTRFAEAAAKLDASVFDQLREEVSENGVLTRERNNLKLVNIAKNMGAGFFPRNTDNREPLYVFAIAFEMTCSLSPQLPVKGDPDYETDIRKNLFYDYYTDNLINVLTETKKSENDVSGYGMNYKNYIEAAYLRCIMNPGAPLEKLREAREIIHDCEKRNDPNRQSAYEIEDKRFEAEGTAEPKYSLVYRDELQAHLADSKETFCQFLLDQYVCRFDDDEILGHFDGGPVLFEEDEVVEPSEEDKKKKGKGRSSIRKHEFSAELRTAERYYTALARKLAEAPQETRSIVQLAKERMPVDQLLPDLDPGKRRDLAKLTQAFLDRAERDQKMLNHAQGQTKFRYAEILDVYGNREIKRADLLIAGLDYLTAYLTSHLTDGRTLAELEAPLANYDSFYYFAACDFTFRLGSGSVNGLNAILTECGFMELGAKNVFDLLLLYVAYQHVVQVFHRKQTEEKGEKQS